LNSLRKGCPRGKTILVWTHLGLIKWKMTSKKIRNGRRTQNKKKEDDLKQKMKDDLKKTITKNEDEPKKIKKNGRQP
jgi:hypothetical protein